VITIELSIFGNYRSWVSAFYLNIITTYWSDICIEL